MIDYTHANASYLPPGYRWGHLFRRVWLGGYYPPFLERLLELKARAADRGHEYVSEYGYRPMSVQAKLRQAYLDGKGGRAAPAGLSAHQYGLADDSTADADTTTPGLQPTWISAAYGTLGEEATAAGLVWGASFGDRPHVQWPNFVNGVQLGILRAKWLAVPDTDEERLKAVWAYLDTLPAPPWPALDASAALT